jgi:L-histidine Nalpha-methyltransferase
VEGVQLLRRLERVIEETDFAWSLCLVGEDQARKLADLTADLKRSPSSAGDGKQIVSGYSYWGIEPTIAWKQACTDDYYRVAKEGIESFGRRWRTLQPDLGNEPYHYISLGPGTGDKDLTVLLTLQPRSPDMFYVPVDMSAEMLRVCMQPMNFLPFITTFRKQLLPIQLDFSSDENLKELDDLRDRLLGDEPALFSLLGNTAANFEDDVELIGRLSRQLLRPRDRIMLEVATVSEVNDATARLAAGEYERSKAFREFATSALHQHTDLPIDRDSVFFEGMVEDDRAVLVKVIYRNRSQQEYRMTLPDRDVVTFPPDDTIRLYLTRKYDRAALDAALRDLELTVVSSARTEASAGARSPYRFGLDLILLSSGTQGGRPSTPVHDLFRTSR